MPPGLNNSGDRPREKEGARWVLAGSSVFLSIWKHEAARLSGKGSCALAIDDAAQSAFRQKPRVALAPGVRGA